MKTIALTGGGSAGHVVPHLSMPSTRHGAKRYFLIYLVYAKHTSWCQKVFFNISCNFALLML